MSEHHSCRRRPTAISAGHFVQMLIAQGVATALCRRDQIRDARRRYAAICAKPSRNGRVRGADIRREIANLWPYVFQAVHDLGLMHIALMRVNTFCINHCGMHYP